MNLFRRQNESDLEAELRRSRPRPRPEFVAVLAGRIGHERRRSGRLALRLGFAGGLTAALLIALATVGGLGYAATGVKTAATAVSRVVTAQKKPNVVKLSAAADQYGDKVDVCFVQPNAKQHTITIPADNEASFLAQHPGSYPGMCV
jgi:hypothetical protein